MSRPGTTSTAPTVLAAAGAVLFALAVLGGAAARLQALAQRPMHTDEAVQAVKTGELLETGRYAYDPREYHGPSLYYLTLPVARAAGERTTADLREETIRLVPALFGLGLLLLVPLFREGLGRAGVALGAGGLAVSPFLIFFSRYYVQESLLVFFTALLAAAVWRYTRRPHAGWAALAGAAAGLMFATKETSAIAWAAAAAGLPFLWAGRPAAAGPDAARRLVRDLALAAGVALAVAALFFTSFFTRPAGLTDAFAAYGFFARRAGGQGHEKPWFYYLQILFAHRAGPLGWWSAAWLLPPAIAAAVLAFARNSAVSEPRKRLVRFLAVFTVATFLLYSAIPYKTPWLILTPLWSLILLAAAGLAEGFERCRGWGARAALGLFAAAATADFARQSHWINGRFASDPRNPCAYEHTSADLRNAVRLIKDAAIAAGPGAPVRIHVVSPEYWPLPWYLRSFEHVGYWAEPPDRPDAPILVTSPELRPALDARLKDRYVESLFGLRPNVVLYVLVREDLWGRLLALRAARPADGGGGTGR